MPVFYTVDRESAAVTVIRIVYGGRNLESLAFQLAIKNQGAVRVHHPNSALVFYCEMLWFPHLPANAEPAKRLRAPVLGADIAARRFAPAGRRLGVHRPLL